MHKRSAPGLISGGVFLALAWAAALVTGCSSAPLPRAEPAGPSLSSRAKISWRGREPSPEVRRELFEHLDAAELVYRARYPRGPLGVFVVELWNAEELPPDLDPRIKPGEHIHGQAIPSLGLIRLPWRGRYPLSAVVHELHHIAGGDRDHLGPRWPEVQRLGERLAKESWGWGRFPPD